MHLFAFSAREGTRAASLPNPVHPTIIHDRMRRAAVLEAELANTFRHSLIGRNLDVLVETADEARPGHVVGTACRGVRVSLRGLLPALRRKLVPVRAIGVEGDLVMGDPVAEHLGPSRNWEKSSVLPTKLSRLALPVC